MKAAVLKRAFADIEQFSRETVEGKGLLKIGKEQTVWHYPWVTNFNDENNQPQKIIIRKPLLLEHRFELPLLPGGYQFTGIIDRVDLFQYRKLNPLTKRYEKDPDEEDELCLLEYKASISPVVRDTISSVYIEDRQLQMGLYAVALYLEFGILPGKFLVNNMAGKEVCVIESTAKVKEEARRALTLTDFSNKKGRQVYQAILINRLVLPVIIKTFVSTHSISLSTQSPSFRRAPFQANWKLSLDYI